MSILGISPEQKESAYDAAVFVRIFNLGHVKVVSN